jgi:uncharacterized protein
MKTTLAAFASGLVFGVGLVISGMTDPLRVLGFLDVFGQWDPTLAFVMGGALLVTLPGYALLRRNETALLGAPREWPTATAIDGALISGAALFGLGWGLVGLCPGPALVNLASLSPKIFGFVVAMAISARARDALQRARASRPQAA